MRIMVGVGHPKHVHLFKNVVNDLIEKGHELKIVAWDKDITINLLNTYGFDYESVGLNYNSIGKKAYGLIKSDAKIYKISREFKPDILIGGAPYLAHVSKLIRKPHIGFTDTEHAKLANWLFLPFSNTILTPSIYKEKINPIKHVPYNGFEELAYLHPNYFNPDKNVLQELDLNEDDKFILIRLISWKASHDVKQFGISNEMMAQYISKLEKYGRVFISSEKEIGAEFEKYRLKIAPEKFHSLLSYAQLYIGEGGSTATEAAILGTPSIHISTTAKYCSVFEDLGKYNLIYTYDDDHKALEKAIEILSNPKSKETWIHKKELMLKEKIDITELIIELIEGYSNNFQ